MQFNGEDDSNLRGVISTHMKAGLVITVEVLEMAVAFIDYSDKIAVMLHAYNHKLAIPKSTAWASDLTMINVPIAKIVPYKDKIVQIFNETTKVDKNKVSAFLNLICEVLLTLLKVAVKEICTKNFFPQCTGNVRKITTKMERCMYFLKVISSFLYI